MQGTSSSGTPPGSSHSTSHVCIGTNAASCSWFCLSMVRELGGCLCCCCCCAGGACTPAAVGSLSAERPIISPSGWLRLQPAVRDREILHHAPQQHTGAVARCQRCVLVSVIAWPCQVQQALAQREVSVHCFSVTHLHRALRSSCSVNAGLCSQLVCRLLPPDVPSPQLPA